jgi:hypothetical protein
MSFLQIIKPWSSLKNSAPRLAVAMGLMISSLLVGCGGGGSSSSDTVSDSGSGSVSGPGQQNPAPTVNSGVYTTSFVNSSGSQKALTLVINSDASNSTEGRFYGWQFNSPEATGEQPDIFSGTILGLGSPTSSVLSLKEFSTFKDTLKDGAATFTTPTQGKLKVDVSQSGNTIQWSDAVGVTLDTTNSLVGTWTGNLYFPEAVAPFTVSITFSSNLSFTDIQFGGTCRTSNGSSLSSSVTGMYNLSMDLANATGCVLRNDYRKPGSLSGVAYVTTSPVAGKTKRLQWVAITSEGRGLSFRADR